MEEIHQSPWGTWEVLDQSPEFKVKKITVKPGQRLSYQKHAKREENWFIVQGSAQLTLNGEESFLEESDFIHIPLGALHRVKNTSDNKDLIFVEIQRGSYFGEDDIVRIADDYGRS
jgi:mannose-6-phosphate isomerase